MSEQELDSFFADIDTESFVSLLAARADVTEALTFGPVGLNNKCRITAALKHLEKAERTYPNEVEALRKQLTEL